MMPTAVKNPISEREKLIIVETVTAVLKINKTKINEPIKNTEARLYALPTLERKIKKDKTTLEDYRKNGLHTRSKDIVRFRKTGYRITPDDMLDAVIQDLEAQIAIDEHEVEIVRGAMETFKNDEYYSTVTGRYINRYEDEDVAAELNCSSTQVWKQRTKLLRDIALMLYGAAGLS